MQQKVTRIKTGILYDKSNNRNNKINVRSNNIN